MRPLRLTALEGELAIWRLPPGAPTPTVAPGVFLSIARTSDELSIVSASTSVPDGVDAEVGWRCLKVEGPLAFEMTGVLAALSAPLAKAGVPIFVVSTYDTDYLLVKTAHLDRACSTLRADGHEISVETPEP